MEVQDVNVSKISGVGDSNPDKGLLENIKSVGVRLPVLLSVNGCADFVVIDGRRRVAAARDLGLETVPAIVMNEDTSPLLGVMLNIHRSPNPAYEVEKIKELIAAGLKQDEIAAAMNTNKTRLKRHFHLLNLCDEGLKRVEDGTLRLSAALSLSRLPVETQKKLLSENERLTSRVVHKTRRDYSLEKFSLPFEEELSIDPLIVEFEAFAAKISTGKSLPQDVNKAVEAIRLHLKKKGR